jgi:hypothetical protein
MHSKDKSDIGILWSDQIASIDTDADIGNNIIAVLNSVSNTLGLTMIWCILDTTKLLGTIYAFMIPCNLSMLMNRVDLVIQRAMIVTGEADVKSMVHVHGGFNVIGSCILLFSVEQGVCLD